MKWGDMFLHRVVTVLHLFVCTVVPLLLVGGCTKGVRYMDLAVSHAPNNAALQDASLRKVDTVVATVGDVPILFSELVKVAGLQTTAPRDAQWRRRFDDALEQLILQTLAEEYLRTKQQSVPDANVTATVQEIKSKNGITSDADFGRKLAASGLSLGDLRRSVARQIAYVNCMNIVLGPLVIVSDQDLKREYDMRKLNAQEWHLQRMMISAASIEEKRNAVEQLNQAKVSIDKGTPFAEAARKVLGGSQTDDDLDMGWVDTIGNLDISIQKALLKAKAGQLIGPLGISESNNVQLLRLVEIRPKPMPPFEQVKDVLYREMVNAKMASMVPSFKSRLQTIFPVRKMSRNLWEPEPMSGESTKQSVAL